jgi:hypothetical protein
VVHAPAADLAEGMFKRPPLFKEGDAVEFAAPERRIKVRTFGLVNAVKHVGAQPYYVVTSAKGTIYSFSEDCLRHKGSVDPNFALRGPELVTISSIDAVGTVLMLESVDEVVDESADDLYADAEAGHDNSADAAATSPEDMARAQAALLMTTFESRLQEHSEAVQSKLHSQLEALVSKQQLAHERMLLTLSTHSNTIDARDAREQQPMLAAAVNPRLVAPVADDFTTPAPREVPLQELMTSPLQALRSGALAMAGTQRRTSFGKVFDLNSSGGTASSQSPAMLADEPKSGKPAAAAGKEDDSYVAEYYARAQLANAKLVRQYRTRIEELKRSSFPSIAYYLRLLMHTGGKLVGFTVRRLSWAELCLVGLLVMQLAPWLRPRLAPSLRAMRYAVMDYLLAIQQNSAASLRAAIATGLAGLSTLISQRSTTHAQELVDQRTTIRAQLLNVPSERVLCARAPVPECRMPYALLTAPCRAIPMPRHTAVPSRAIL